MDSQREDEITRELKYLEDKKCSYGWTESDAIKYHHYRKLLGYYD